MRFILRTSLLTIALCFISTVTLANSVFTGNVTLSETLLKTKATPPTPGFHRALLPLATLDGGSLNRTASENLITPSSLRKDSLTSHD